MAIASGAKMDSETSIYVTGINECRFKRMVVPGDVMILHSRIEKHKMGIFKLACHVTVDGQLASEAKVTATTGPAPKAPELPAGLPAPIFEV